MPRIDSRLSVKFLKECFDYIPETGLLLWRERPLDHFGNNAGTQKYINDLYAGKEAGYSKDCKNSEYRYVRVSKVKYSVHRLIMILIHGVVPDEVDHIDGNGLNNRIDNLRYVNRTENSRNTKVRTTNTTGIIGVRQNYETKSYKVTIGLGSYPEIWDAICMRMKAQHLLGYHNNHGRR